MDSIPTITSNGQASSVLELATLEQQMFDLGSAGFIHKLSKQQYSFNNKLIWEVVYDAVMYSEKRRLHNLVGLYIEKINKENLDAVANLLLHHFESGQNHQKTVYYGALAGDRAARMFAGAEAIHSYDRALSALQKMANDKPFDRSMLLEKCGDVYQNSGDYQMAGDKYQAALHAWGQTGNDGKAEYVPWGVTHVSRRSNLCHKLSVSHEHASNYDESNAWINKAIKFLPEDSKNTAPRIYAAKSAIHYRKAEYKEAITMGERALGIAGITKAAGDLAYSHNIVANSFTRMGRLQEAIKHLQQAVAIYDREQNFTGIASANSNLASCYMHSDNLEYAIRHYQVALDADQRTQNNAMIAIGHNNLGEVYLMQGRLEESEMLFGKVLEAHKKGYAHDALTGYAMMNISRCKLYSGNLDASKLAIEEALGLIKNAGVKTVYVEAELQYASVLLSDGQLKEARDLCESVRQEIKTGGAKLLEVKADRILARTLEKQGDIRAALETISNSITLANNIGSKYQEGKSLNEYARMMFEHEKGRELAGQSLARAGDIFSQIGAVRELAITQTLKSRLAQQTK